MSMNAPQFCINVDYINFANRKFPDSNPAKTTLIMIGDPGFEFNLPAKKPVASTSPIAQIHPAERSVESDWAAVHQFCFVDTEEAYSQAITLDQAADLYSAIVAAKDRGDNIVVHCYAGVSRSGAVTEFATRLGFVGVEGVSRVPNSRVLELLRYIHRSV